MPLKVYIRSGHEVVYEAVLRNTYEPMAVEAGIRDALWNPPTNAIDLVLPLRKALETMKNNPARFKSMNEPEGWVNHEHFSSWVKDYLDSCVKYPIGTVSVIV